MKDKILQHLTTGARSFAELIALVGDPGGDHTVTQGDEPNIVLWTGMSQEFAMAIKDLGDEGSISCHELLPPSQGWWALSQEGPVPDLPVVEEEDKYAEPHWMPAMMTIFTERYNAELYDLNYYPEERQR